MNAYAQVIFNRALIVGARPVFRTGSLNFEIVSVVKIQFPIRSRLRGGRSKLHQIGNFHRHAGLKGFIGRNPCEYRHRAVKIAGGMFQTIVLDSLEHII